MCACMCMWRPKVNLGCCSLGANHPVPWELFSLDQWARRTQLSQPLQRWVTSIPHHMCTTMPGFFTRVLEIQLRSTHLPGKHLPNWVISPFRPVLWASGVKTQGKQRTRLLVLLTKCAPNLGEKEYWRKSSTGVFEPFSLSGYQLILNFHFENLASTNIFFHFVI